MAAGEATRCDGCGRLRYDVVRVALMVGARAAVERDLCRACTCEAVDALVLARALA